MASPGMIRLGIRLGRVLPPTVGYHVADVAGRMLSVRRRAYDVASLRQNLRVVLGPSASEQTVQSTVRRAFRNIARAYYDLYRAVALGPSMIQASVEFTPRAQNVIDTYFGKGRGLVVVTGHYGNYDLAALAYSLLGIPTQVLSWPRSRPDYTVQNEIRSLLGLHVTPLDVTALKQAMKTLQEGGIVATAIDRPPPPGSGEMLSFFGRPARLPVGHVRLALQTNALLLGAHAFLHPERPHVYVLDFEGPYEPESQGDRRQTVLYHAQRMLERIEQHIRQYPEQWYMFHPVWES